MDAAAMPTAGRLGDLVLAWVVVIALLAGVVVCVRWARRRGGRWRLVAGNALLTVALLAAVTAGAETWLRHIHDGTTWHAANLVTQSWFTRHWSRNSEGFRDAEWPDDSTAARRIAVVGDSFTAGYGVARTEDRFADLLRDRLPDADLRLIATIGADTRRQLAQLRAMFRVWQPTDVVLAYSLNDAEYLLDENERDNVALRPPSPGSLASRSFLLDLLRTQRAVVSSGHGERYQRALRDLHKDPVRWQEQEALFREMKSLCAEHDATLHVAIFPLFGHWPTDGDGAYPLTDWHARVEASWRDVGIEPLDLRPVYSGLGRDELVVGRLDAHPNEKAHALCADALVRAFFPDGH